MEIRSPLLISVPSTYDGDFGWTKFALLVFIPVWLLYSGVIKIWHQDMAACLQEDHAGLRSRDPARLGKAVVEAKSP